MQSSKVKYLRNIEKHSLASLIEELTAIKAEFDAAGHPSPKLQGMGQLAISSVRLATESEEAATVENERQEILKNLDTLANKHYSLIILQKTWAIKEYEEKMMVNCPDQQVKLENMKKRLNEYIEARSGLIERLVVLQNASLEEVKMEERRKKV